ncbi:MAG: heavy metal transporter [Acetobacteraceae bacterium]|nr:heavy metal transporter [Acetobacteraceae bacterium]
MIRIVVANMSCGGCAKGILTTLRGAAPGAVAQIDLERHEVAVAASDGAALVAALRAEGWDARVARG